MLVDINSPLMPLPEAHELGQDENHIPLFQTVGVLLSLYALHWQYESQTITQWLGRMVPFLQHRQTRLFLTEDKIPYGFASWIEVSETVHQQLLNHATWAQVEPQLVQWLGQQTQIDGRKYLWFIDLITPFSHALEATKDLKNQLNHHQNAWALNINHGQHVPRRVW